MPCFDFDAAVLLSGSSLVITLQAIPQDVRCITVVATFAYRIQVAPVPVGVYEITLTPPLPGRCSPRYNCARANRQRSRVKAAT